MTNIDDIVKALSVSGIICIIILICRLNTYWWLWSCHILLLLFLVPVFLYSRLRLWPGRHCRRPVGRPRCHWAQSFTGTGMTFYPPSPPPPPPPPHTTHNTQPVSDTVQAQWLEQYLLYWETTTMRDHLSWPTIDSWWDLHFNLTEPVTRDHLFNFLPVLDSILLWTIG